MTPLMVLSVWSKQWRRPGAEFGRDGKIFRGSRFLNDVFSEKISIFTAKISDDFFSHRPGFSDFPLIFPFFAMLNVVYYPFLARKTTISEMNSFMTPFFLLCSYFRAHPTTLLLKILGGRMHEPSPTSNWGAIHPVSPRSPP